MEDVPDACIQWKQETIMAFIGRIFDNLIPVKMRVFPSDMTFEISNTCNLKCIMCSCIFSDLIRKNVEKLPEIPNVYDEKFFEELKEFLPNLKRVRFMGEEPFLIRQYAPILLYLVDKNPSCKIYIQTNGTVLNNAVKKIMESRNVEISISIDSLQKETYERIRRNSSYECMMNNLEYFSKRAKDNQQLININFRIMNNNWREVPDIIDFCDRNNFTLNMITVENPRLLSLLICSREYMENVL
jgi:MoaA/NifB/PqqE/SkfB family radical SAM enzyme